MSEKGLLERQRKLNLAKEIFRKSIHLCSAAIPFLLRKFYLPIIILLLLAVIIYSVCELLRLHGKTVPLISAVTAAAARKRDENKFVLGPVTLVIGIMMAALFYNPLPAAAGIFALSFGDGSASLAGKLFGRVKIPLSHGKTAAGSLTCFAAIYISCALTLFFWNGTPVCGNCTLIALSVAMLGMFIEVLPLKDFDNVLIPVAAGGLCQYLLTVV